MNFYIKNLNEVAGNMYYVLIKSVDIWKMHDGFIMNCFNL